MNRWQLLKKEIDALWSDPKRIDALSYDSSWVVRSNVAAHRNTSTATLTRLALDVHGFVRNDVLRNPNTPPLVKMWLQGGYSDMTLEEFLEASK